jgi:Tfp pilus assembly protein PilO
MSGIMRNKRAVAILGVALLLLTAMAGWFLVVSGEFDNKNQVNAQLENANLTLATNKQQITTLCMNLKNVQGVLEQAAQNQAKFPPTADITDLFTQIRQAANGVGIPTSDITEVQAPAPAIGNVATVAEMALTITVVAKPTQVAPFLAALESMPRSFILSNLAVAPGSSPSRVAVTIAGNAFIIQTKPLSDTLTEINSARANLTQSCREQGVHIDAMPSATPSPAAPTQTLAPTPAATPTATPTTSALPTPSAAGATTGVGSTTPGTTPPAGSPAATVPAPTGKASGAA